MKERNLGVDLLRMVSMYMICLLHVLGKGGLLQAAESPQHEWLWLLEMACLCSLNGYAMISGYVGWNRKSLRFAPLAQLWLQTAFWGVVLLLPFLPQLRGEELVHYAKKALLPVTHGDYWYLTAYVCLYFVLPILNRFLQEATPRQLLCGAGAAMALFSIVPTILQRDLFGTLYGYSPLWLGVMYVLGGTLARLQKEEARRKWPAALAYAACVLASWAMYLLIPKVKPSFDQQQFSSYTQPLMVCAALALVHLFSGLRIRSAFAARMIRFLAPLAFGVYVIHLHPLASGVLFGKKLAPIAHWQPVALAAVCLGYALALYAGCSLLDAVRRALFSACRLGRLLTKAEERVRSSL